MSDRIAVHGIAPSPATPPSRGARSRIEREKGTGDEGRNAGLAAEVDDRGGAAAGRAAAVALRPGVRVAQPDHAHPVASIAKGVYHDVTHLVEGPPHVAAGDSVVAVDGRQRIRLAIRGGNRLDAQVIARAVRQIVAELPGGRMYAGLVDE